MRIIIADIQVDDYDGSWISLFQIDSDYQPSLLHLEYTYGVFKWDLFGINALYRWWEDKHE